MSTAMTCAVMLQQNGKLLLVQEAAAEVYGKWNQPAGHLEPGETILACAVRETREESGYEVILTGLQAIYNYSIEPGQTIINFCLLAEPRGDAGPLDQTEILATRWFSRAELQDLPRKQLRHALTERRIEDWLEGKSWPLDVIARLD